jgi:hypothetical protein
LSLADLTALYETQLGELRSMTDFRHARVHVNPDDFVPRGERERYAALPSSVPVRDKEVEIHYDVEETPDGNVGVARLRLPEKLARTLAEEELPSLDRPLRFIVMRGARGAARAATLGELQEELERPFTEKEIAEMDRAHEEQRRERRDRHDRKRKREGDRRSRDGGGNEKLKDDRRPQDESFEGRRRRKGGGGGRFKPPGGKKGRRP